MDRTPTQPTIASEEGSALPERQERRRVELAGHLVQPDGVVLDVRILDFSYNGCQLTLPRFVIAGDEVKLSVPNRGAIGATVRWCEGGRAGLRFHDEPQEKEEIERNAERVPAEIEAQLRRVGRLAYSVSLRDVSPEGCKVELVERPAVGEVMHLKLPGLESLEGRARWVEGHVAGLKFKHPLHPAVFAMLLDRLGG
jgi:PilZ domain-containing protein